MDIYKTIKEEMKMKKIEYAALKYYNSCISEECLYVGMLFNNITDNERKFISIKNFRRLSVFDDDINIDFFKDYLKSIKDEVETNIFNYFKEFDMKEYIRPFTNELKFSKITSVETDESDFMENICKLYLKYDYDKKERLSKETEKHYIQRVLKSSNIPFTREPICGKHNEQIKFDFVTDDFVIKVFDFEDKDLTRIISSVKSWAYNAREMKEEKKTIFLYDSDILGSEEFRIIKSILSEDAYKVLPVDRGIEYITA